MNNSDMPAMPFEGGSNNGLEPSIGLTKREHFAGLAMQGFCASNLYEAHDRPEGWLQDTIESSIEFADALLKELEK